MQDQLKVNHPKPELLMSLALEQKRYVSKTVHVKFTGIHQSSLSNQGIVTIDLD